MSEHPSLTKHSLGYEPIFVDRQMIIQLLYDNLRNKSKVLTKKGVTKVEQTTEEVLVTTEDGSTFHGDVLVGADGIHSAVRCEMWRLADKDSSGHFPMGERLNVPTEYCCIFGISQPNDKFPKYSSQNIQGQKHSYLVATGPNHRIYWFLFKKLPDVARGLYDKIPRFTDEQKDALAAEHANDVMSDTLTFGELYASRTTATLQALPEVVFQKWHYNQIITIGDAAHKVRLLSSLTASKLTWIQFNPIGGQGGNSAIEDAAVLANQLHALVSSSNTGPTDAQISQALAETQRIRFPRAMKFLKASHDNQSIQAQDTFTSRLIARYIVPLSGPEKVLQMICEGARGAANINALPMPQRPHSQLWDDELKPRIGFAWKRMVYAASVGFGVLALLMASGGQLPVASSPRVLLSAGSGV